MTPLALKVAWWEFRRFFKPKEQLWSMLITIVSGSIGYGLYSFASRDRVEPVTVGVIHGEMLPITLPAGSRITLRPADIGEEAELRRLVGDRKLDGLLIVESPDKAELFVNKRPSWRGELEQAISGARTALRLTELNLAPLQLAAISMPVALELTYHADGTRPSTAAERIAAVIIIVLALIGVFMGVALFLQGITGEKQLRATEQVVAAIGPQAWIDGKLIGLTAAALGSMLSAGVGMLLFVLAWQWFGAKGLVLPPAVFDPWMVISFVVLGLLGLAFWNCYLGAIAATIDDPNTSTRGGLLFLPMIPVGLCFLVFVNPDAPSIRILSLAPGLSYALLPARLVLSEVAWWELPVAIGLGVAAIWGMRRLAGRIFATAILMYGKEPSLREVWRWARARPSAAASD